MQGYHQYRATRKSSPHHVLATSSTSPPPVSKTAAVNSTMLTSTQSTRPTTSGKLPKTSDFAITSNSTSISISSKQQQQLQLQPSSLSTHDHRIPVPSSQKTLSRCLSSLRLSASLALKLLHYISHPSTSPHPVSLSLSKIFALKSKKNSELEERKEHLKVALMQFAREDRGLDSGEFGLGFSCAGGGGGEGGEKRSKEFMMVTARCEGRKEAFEYACSRLILQSESRIRETIVKPLSLALNNNGKGVPAYADLISEASGVLEESLFAVYIWTRKLRDEVRAANAQLEILLKDGGGGGWWDGDVKAWEREKREQREELLGVLGI